MDLKELDDFMADSNARALRGRLLAHELLGLVILVIFCLAAFLFIAAPNFIDGMSLGPGPFPAWALGAAGIVVGLVWMVRIARAKPEPDTKAWRYRR